MSESDYILETLLDITDRKKAEEKLRLLNHKLERAITEKNEFLRAVSHDLSAPLRNISGMATFLKTRYAGVLDETGADRLERILKNIKVQNGFIQDLLELSRIKTRRERIVSTDLDLMLRAIVEQFAFDLEKKSGMVEVVGKLPTIWCESNRLRQVFQNLIDNAIKYAHPDRPARIRVACAEEPDRYRFTVEDNGISMRPEDAAKAFLVFQRAHNPFMTNIEGKGVGLASVKSILENYDGEIWVESEEGKGSTFTFTLPRTAVTAPPARQEDAYPETEMVSESGTEEKRPALAAPVMQAEGGDHGSR